MSDRPKWHSEYLGCQSGGCHLERPKGMHHNGPCGCLRGLDTAQRIMVEKALQRRDYDIKELKQESAELHKALELAINEQGMSYAYQAGLSLEESVTYYIDKAKESETDE